MDKRFYLDTAIWRDYFEDRGNGIRPLGEFAFRFLKECRKHKCKVLYSELIIHELKRDYSNERIKQLFSAFKKVLIKVDISNEQLLESERLAQKKKEAHQSDVLHAVLARDNNAIMVTRDIHFECLCDIVEIVKPEDVHF